MPSDRRFPQDTLNVVGVSPIVGVDDARSPSWIGGVRIRLVGGEFRGEAEFAVVDGLRDDSPV